MDKCVICTLRIAAKLRKIPQTFSFLFHYLIYFTIFAKGNKHQHYEHGLQAYSLRYR